MRTPLQPGETVVRQGAANMRRGIEGVGGRLYLTDSRLVFESHYVNVQVGTSTMDLDAVRSATHAWTRVFGAIPLAHNCLRIELTDGTVAEFTVSKVRAWLGEVDAVRSRRPS